MSCTLEQLFLSLFCSEINQSLELSVSLGLQHDSSPDIMSLTENEDGGAVSSSDIADVSLSSTITDK